MLERSVTSRNDVTHEIANERSSPDPSVSGQESSKAESRTFPEVGARSVSTILFERNGKLAIGPTDERKEMEKICRTMNVVFSKRSRAWLERGREGGVAGKGKKAEGGRAFLSTPRVVRLSVSHSRGPGAPRHYGLAPVLRNASGTLLVNGRVPEDVPGSSSSLKSTCHVLQNNFARPYLRRHA